MSVLITQKALANEGEFDALLAGMDHSLNCAYSLTQKTDTAFQKALSGLDLQNFVKKTVLDGQDEYFNVTPGTLENTPPEELPWNVVSLYSGEVPWAASLVPIEGVRMSAFSMTIETLSEKIFKLTGKKVVHVDEISSELKRISTLGLTHQDQEMIHANAESMRRERNLKTQIPNDYILYGLCFSNRVIMQSKRCVSGLKKILLDMTPVDRFSSVTLVDEFESFLLEKKNFRAVLDAADRIQKLVADPSLQTKGFFDEIKNAFLRAGFQSEEAYENTWKFMGIYSTGGANIGPRVRSFLNQASDMANVYTQAFVTIAMGGSVLDSRLLSSGRLFSYPANIATTIDNAKPYHFWMSAYLARKVSLASESSEAGLQAAWLAQLGYQIKSDTRGRDPSRAFSTEAFGPANNKIRIDLAFASNGVVFGANSTKNISTHRFDIDQTLQQILAAGEVSNPLSSEKAKKIVNGYSYGLWVRWNRLFAPSSALRAARKGVLD